MNDLEWERVGRVAAEAEAKRLRDEVKNERHRASVASTECAALHERLRDAEAEVERLRAAGEQAASFIEDGLYAEARKVLRRALGGK